MTGPLVDDLEIPAESRYVATARNFVVDALRGAPWLDGDQIDDLRLVVSETVTNALRAQADHRDADLVRVRVAVYDDRVEISVIDAAGGFDVPAGGPSLPEPDLRHEGGFGLALIEALSDEAHFTRTTTGTTVRVVVYRERQHRAAG